MIPANLPSPNWFQDSRPVEVARRQFPDHRAKIDSPPTCRAAS
jgi:hypothetical protein